METRANYVLVGAFTLVVLVAGFLFVYWTANVANQDSRVELLVRIEGSVNGLSVGSQVLFNGLRVGDVRNLRIDPNDPRTVIATTRVDGTTPITTSTRATIGFAGLTGQAFIELKGGSVNERNIIQYAQEQGAVPVIRADPSDVTDILATAKDIADRANNILGQFEAVVNDIGPAVRTTADNITATSGNVRRFTDTLANNSDNLQNFLASAGRLADSANTVATELPSTVRAVRGVVEAVNPQDVRDTLNNVAVVTAKLREKNGDIDTIFESARTAAAAIGRVGDAIDRNTPSVDRLIANLGPLSDNATRVAANLNQTVDRTNQVLASIDGDSVRRTVDNVTALSQTLRDQAGNIGGLVESAQSAVRSFGRVGDVFAANAPDIDQLLDRLGPISADAQRIAANLNQTVDRANGILAGVDTQKINQTVDQVSSFVAAINAKTPTIQSAIDVAESTLRTIDLTVGNFNGTREHVDQILSGINPDTITRAVNNVGQATDNVARAADSVARVANDVGNRRDDINAIITDARETTRKVNEASTRLQSVLASADRFLNEDSTNGLVQRATTSLAAVQDAANRVGSAATALNNQIGPISSSIQGFTDRSLPDIRNFIGAATSTVNKVGAAVDSLSSNPQRILFGGDEIKQYNGRTRR
ncbi:MCE family protein [Aureimonas leprariae]|uniref:MCE family protein n=1 Tax=Plantimonas leprariae TaxID=2615207 RepID=A0A7V7PR19_9HYPH|nr:MlaD family protein [Aureimonas leprariae]KAB0680842.1 MCE family protein [Aureimonas leprariae]